MGIFKSRLDNSNNSERSSRKFIRNSNEAPYQMLGTRTLAATLGYKELSTNRFWISLLSECLSCYLYVFVVCSTRISWTGSIIGHEPNLLAMALTSGIAMMLLIFTFRTVHVNPALTISFLMNGRIPLIRAIFYIIAHCLGAVAAIAFLYSISIKGHAGALGLDNPHDILESWQILIVELVISFVVTLATYATCNFSSYTCAKKLVLEELGQSSNLFSTSNNLCDNINSQRHSRHTVAPIVPPSSNTLRPNPPSKGFLLNSYHEDNSNYDLDYDNHRIYTTQQLRSESSSQVPIEEVVEEECQLLAPNGFSLHVTSGQSLVIGLAYTLTSLSGIPASGASLNPARSFGPAFIMNHWDRHWIYWLGPILGAVIAGFFYEFIFSPTRKSSLCYRPKLFRFSAHDMAKVGSKSRSYQHQLHQQQNFSNQPPTSLFRPKSQILSVEHHNNKEQVVYDKPESNLRQFRTTNPSRRSLLVAGASEQQMLEQIGFLSPALQSMRQLPAPAVNHKPFNTVHPNSVRPHSMALEAQSMQQSASNFHLHLQRQQQQQQQPLADYEQLDDDLYNISNEQTFCNARNAPNVINPKQTDYFLSANNTTENTSDSSQRTNEVLPASADSKRTTASSYVMQRRHKDDDLYYN